MQINGFELVNEEKLGRVINGTVGRSGLAEGGLGEDAAPELILAHYDKLGGLILKGMLKVKTGSFWDIEKKAPRKEPDLAYLTELDGKVLEVTEQEAETLHETKKKLEELKEKQSVKKQKRKREV